ncbi:hypothetical protein PMI16_00072 [Herbaspirillum sp. CF444]|uniref:hypothetical protein n=1 Tax=Herbaspirillum sp. CF444 TaxID=1144319 RepID=UPI0002728360|nr:hypothetical protein [Herbaspirillum sp. CF444]EJL94626.1 hypothetical protein PMI16_00072 [Herbaspirillum sp. CF444]
MMKTQVLRLSLTLSFALSLLTSAAYAQETCVSANPVIGAMQAQWNNARTESAPAFTDGFVPVTLTLLPLPEAESKYGKLAIKSKKEMRFTNRYNWRIETEGDYWIAADSPAWMDVIDVANGRQALEPLTFNQGLRCAGIHKALKFHLHAGSYTLLVASEDIDKVKVSAGRETSQE